MLVCGAESPPQYKNPISQRIEGTPARNVQALRAFYLWRVVCVPMPVQMPVVQPSARKAPLAHVVAHFG
jgi:hypothetical protein